MKPKETFKLSRVILAIILSAIFIIPMTLAYKYKEVVAVIVSDKSPTEQLIADTLRPITERKVYISCAVIDQAGNETGTHTLGETPYIGSIATPVILLSNPTCQAIENFSSSTDKTSPTSQQLQALITIAHEAFHTKGVSNEAEVECYALQRVASTAQELGANFDQAEFIQNLAVNLQRQTATNDYMTNECRDNGPYDLDPDIAGTFPF